MSVPLILTILAGAATFIGAFLGVLGQKPSNRLTGVFARICSGDHVAYLIDGDATCRISG